MNEKDSDSNCGRFGDRPPFGGIIVFQRHRCLSRVRLAPFDHLGKERDTVKKKRILASIAAGILAASMLTITASADVAGAVTSTWGSAKGQIQSVVNNVVFPAIDVILAVLLFVKIGAAYLDYRKHGQLEWTPIAIIFGGLLFSLTAPMYVWTII